jgi:hypothetical protein
MKWQFSRIYSTILVEISIRIKTSLFSTDFRLDPQWFHVTCCMFPNTVHGTEYCIRLYVTCCICFPIHGIEYCIHKRTHKQEKKQWPLSKHTAALPCMWGNALVIYFSIECLHGFTPKEPGICSAAIILAELRPQPRNTIFLFFFFEN